MKFEHYVVKEIIKESEQVRTFKLAKEEGGIPAYQPGHFFLLRLQDENGKSIQRSYSVASHPSENLLWFCVKLKGVFTDLLWKLEVGGKIEVDGPYGIFLLRADDSERIFIAGGVGISAIRSQIIQTIKEGKKAALFHSAKTLEGLTYFPEMKKLSEENANFKFYPTMTCEEKPSGWNYSCGRVGIPMLKEKLGSLENKTFYLCGSKEMAAALSASLMEQGVPKDRIKKDDWA